MVRPRVNMALDPKALQHLRKKTAHKRKGPGKLVSKLLLDDQAREDTEQEHAPLSAAVQAMVKMID